MVYSNYENALALEIPWNDFPRLCGRPGEIYTLERKAEFLLSNTVDAKDYQAAVEEVRKLGIDPSKVPRAEKALRPKRS
jgi:hypothetical protein